MGNLFTTYTFGSVHWEESLGAYAGAVEGKLAEMRDRGVMRRIWAMDHTVWQPQPTEITDRLGWLRIMDEVRGGLPRLEAFSAAVRRAGYRRVLLMGMGGSSLAPEVFGKTFGAREGYLDLAVLDSTDPEAVLRYAEALDYSQTLFIVSTKSGGTVETFSFLKYFYNRLLEKLGAAEVGAHFAAITDPGSKLGELAAELGFRETFLNNPQIGGRYSALSYFGLVPAALLGVDLRRLLDDAQDMADLCLDEGSPAARLGAVLGELANLGRDKATFLLSPGVASFGDWAEQLIAESTGKQGKGILPVVGELPGKPEIYAADRLFIELRAPGDESRSTTLHALAEAGHPVLRLEWQGAYALGGQYFLWELATAVAGHCLQINPFDQPNVESAKVLARQMVADYMANGALPPAESAPLSGTALLDFLGGARPGGYLAIQAYLPPDESTDRLLLDFRQALRQRTHMATTLGYGPRFLHSTGQLHKGDAGKGLFMQLTADARRDAPIPDEPGVDKSSLSFGLLIRAQALGDGQALRDAGRQVIRFHLGGDIQGNLSQLVRWL